MLSNQKIKINIKNMHCSSCTMLIDGGLEDLNGVISASTSYYKGYVEVEFNNKVVSLEEIMQVIKKLGYIPIT